MEARRPLFVRARRHLESERLRFIFASFYVATPQKIRNRECLYMGEDRGVNPQVRYLSVLRFVVLSLSNPDFLPSLDFISGGRTIRLLI